MTLNDDLKLDSMENVIHIIDEAIEEEEKE